MHRAQTIPLDGRSNGAHQRRCNQQRRPETDPAADLKSEERSEHVEAGVSKIQDAEHAEDDGEAARHQEQQHAVKHAVQRRYHDQFKHSGTPTLEPYGSISLFWRVFFTRPGTHFAGKRPRPSRYSEVMFNRNERRVCDDQFGLSILQVVGSMVCGESILATCFQPQPVCSSSNGSLSVRSPSEAM